MLLFAFSAICLGMAHACEHGRASGLFWNGFTSTVATDSNFVVESGDTNAAYGDSVPITFTNDFKVFDTTGRTGVTIFDNGLLFFAGTQTIPYVAGLDVFAIVNQAFATPLWFSNDGPAVQYRFKYRHLKASDMVSNDKDVGPSMCDLQRISNIIGDCTDNGYRLSAATTTEALIVTWEVSQGNTEYYFQAVLATRSDGETYIIYLYSDPTNMPAGVSAYSTGYIGNHLAALTTFQSAGVCPNNDGTPLTTSSLAKQSNCRCGSHNEGVYTFKTTVASTCPNTKATFDTECQKNIATDNTVNFNMNCRPPRNTRDSCLDASWNFRLLCNCYGGNSARGSSQNSYPGAGKSHLEQQQVTDYYNPITKTESSIRGLIEQVECKETPAGFQVNINIMNPPHTAKTAIRFINTATNAQNTQTKCEPTVVQISTNVYRASMTLMEADIGDCDWNYNVATKEISFTSRVFDSDNVELDVAGNVYLKATCDLLPESVSVSVKKGGILTYNIPTPSDRRVEMFISKTRWYDQSRTDLKIPNSAIIPLGQDLFLTVAYDWGATLAIDKVHPYGIYVYDCIVANNPQFTSTGNMANGSPNRVINLIDSDGCVNAALTSEKGFFIMEGFKVALMNSPTTVGIVSDIDTTTYNFAQSAAKFDAAKWLADDGNDQIYFQCKAKFGRNQGFRTDSRCWDSCAKNPNVDYVVRRKRDVNDTTDEDYPEVTLQTSVRIERPPPQAEKQIECVSNVVAYSTMLALTVLLLVAMGVTLMMFVKLNARQRKRI